MPILRQPSNCRHVHVINQIIGDFHWPTILPSLKCIEAQIEARIEAGQKPELKPELKAYLIPRNA